MQLFYQPEIPNEVHHLDEEESRHCIKVLRKNKGDELSLTDGKGKFYKVVIKDPNPKRCTFEIQSEEIIQPKNYRIHIALAPTKQLERTEWFVEKAVEIGVDELTFFYTRYSERKNLKIDRLQKKAISALKQSLKSRLPKINNPLPFKDFITDFPTSYAGFIAAMAYDTPHLMKRAPAGQNYCLLIGPEGGFSDEEMSQAHEEGFISAGLGKERLRTETAGIAGCLILNLLHEI